MAYRHGQRHQQMLFPQSIDEYVEQDAPVRAYDAIIEAMDLIEMGFELDPQKVGCPQYHPQAMLKLLVYGYSYGIRSSRKLERACHYDVSFIWITGGLKPDHKTIAQFRRNNKSALTKVLRHCARLCVKLDLIEGNTLFIDGTKIRANASIKHSWTPARGHRHLEKIDRRIQEILLECEAADRQEADQASLVKMKESLKDQKTLKSKVKAILNELQAEDKRSTNTTDPDCKPMHSLQGSHSAYNVQSVVDEKQGLIVNSDVVNENNDLHQFAEQIEQAHETLGKKCQTACADAGYSNVAELEKIDEQGIQVIVPSKKQAAKKNNDAPFDQSRFTYDAERDSYICPEGHALKYSYTNTFKKTKVYRAGSVCKSCRYFGDCTRHPKGRTITRLLKADLQQKLEAQYEDPESQKIYALRKQKVELPFGHIKRNLKMDGFLMRGLEGVNAEASILSSCFNIARMISLLGVSGIIAQLAR